MTQGTSAPGRPLRASAWGRQASRKSRRLRQFPGVLPAYGLVGPFAGRLKGMVEEEAKYYEVIRAVLVTHLHGIRNLHGPFQES